MSWAGIGRGLRAMMAATPAVFAFGIGFGAAAAAIGIDTATALTMIATVFSSQYAALDFWHFPIPLLGLAVMTMAVNARHLILAATLRTWMGPLPPGRRYAALFLLSDANWAATHQAIGQGERDAGHLVGGGLALWVAWLAGTYVGVAGGGRIGDLGRFGIDLVMPAFFACTLIGMTKRPRDMPPWMVAGIAAVIFSLILPSHWAVIAGTVAGGAFGAWFDER
jgi:predicted branched-subunit amino acid permease